MTIDAVDFASLLCSRVCHDLLSPVGAMNNGLELLADETDPGMRAQCMDLLEDSATSTANKLKFFRLAFGAAGGFDDQIDVNEARAAIEGLYCKGGRITLGWMVSRPTMSKPAIKVMLNMALIAGDALVRGGQLDIGVEQIDSIVEIAVKAEGPRVILDPEIRKAMLGETPEDQLQPRGAAAWLAHSIAKRHGGSIRASEAGAPFILFGATLSG